ncbi:hypothetical protein VB714_26495 [Spirulina sp. 06S082]|nr:hypothetical protein [Spirulina sp. 06S082]
MRSRPVNPEAAIYDAALQLIFSNSLIFLPVDPQQWDDMRTVLGDRGQPALTSIHFPCHRS